MKRICLAPAVILFFAACSAKEHQTTAHITQRRLDEKGKLMISYRFQVEGKWIYDSAEVANTIIPHDSVKVVYAVQHPEDSRLLIP